MTTKWEEMSDNDILTLNSIIMNNKQFLIAGTCATIFIEYFIYHYIVSDALDFVSRIIKMILYFVPLVVAISIFMRFYKLILDRKYSEKLVYICKCRIETISVDTILTILVLEDGLRIELDGYNQRNYIDHFSNEPQLFELHLAKWSKTILYCKKMNQQIVTN